MWKPFENDNSSSRVGDGGVETSICLRGIDMFVHIRPTAVCNTALYVT